MAKQKGKKVQPIEIAVMTKMELAKKILDEVFAGNKRILIATAVEIAKARKVSRTTLGRAARSKNIKEVHNGNQPAFWEKSEE